MPRDVWRHMCQNTPRRPQEDPKTAQEAPKAPNKYSLEEDGQDGFQDAQYGRPDGSDGPKMHPRRPEMA
eukprot:1359600-Pyramimonas_sp.AAC.1